MKRFFGVRLIALVFALFGATHSQAQVHMATLFPSVTHSHQAGIGLGYMVPGFPLALNYGKILSLGESRNLLLEAEVTSPIFLIGTPNIDIALGGTMFLLNEEKGFNMKASAALAFKSFEDALANGYGLFYKLDLSPGYYKPNFFVAAHLAFRSNIVTHWNMTADYAAITGNEQVTGTNTVNQFDAGVEVGLRIKERWLLHLKGFYRTNATANQWISYAPYSQHINVVFGVDYGF